MGAITSVVSPAGAMVGAEGGILLMGGVVPEDGSDTGGQFVLPASKQQFKLPVARTLPSLVLVPGKIYTQGAADLGIPERKVKVDDVLVSATPVIVDLFGRYIEEEPRKLGIRGTDLKTGQEYIVARGTSEDAMDAVDSFAPSTDLRLNLKPVQIAPFDLKQWLENMGVPFNRKNHPAVMHSFYDQLGCLQWLNVLTKEDRAEFGIGPFRHLTEAEFEGAARGSEGTFLHGTQTGGIDASLANYLSRATAPVDAKPGIMYGAATLTGITTSRVLELAKELKGMAGNVWQFVFDLWGAYEMSVNLGVPIDNPKGPKKNEDGLRVVRGGGYYLNARNLRSGDRSYGRPVTRDLDRFGFRFGASLLRPRTIP